MRETMARRRGEMWGVEVRCGGLVFVEWNGAGGGEGEGEELEGWKAGWVGGKGRYDGVKGWQRRVSESVSG